MEPIWIISHVVQWIALLSILLMLFKIMSLPQKNDNSIFNNEDSIGLPIGEVMPSYVNIAAHKPVVVLFILEGCLPCKKLLNEIMLNEDSIRNVVLILAKKHDSNENLYSKEFENLKVPFIISTEIVKKSKITVFPFGYALDSIGKIVAKKVVFNYQDLIHLKNA
jgi:thiol-disulfide isomerase/thioredoxin